MDTHKTSRLIHERLLNGFSITLIIVVIGGAFTLGQYFGKRQFDSEKETLFQNNMLLKDSLIFIKSREKSNSFEEIKFNDHPRDFKMMNSENYTTDFISTNPNQNISDLMRPVADAKVGDIINFAIYYNNTGHKIAKNVKVRLFIDYIGNLIIGIVSLSCENSKNIWFGSSLIRVTNSKFGNAEFGTVRWSPDQQKSYQTLPNNQRDDEILEGQGISIGDIKPSENISNVLNIKGGL